MKEQRPTLSTKLSSATFLNFYYLKEELERFCRAHAIPTHGSKNDLVRRISVFLKTGVVPQEPNIKQAIRREASEITLEAALGPNFRCTERHRAFFASHIKGRFHFSTAFQKYLKANPQATYREAVAAWYELQAAVKKSGGKPLEKHFKYNRYIRDFFKHNPDKTFRDAVKCWNYKKGLAGSQAYEDSDLAALH